jgi:hypothetical protein
MLKTAITGRRLPNAVFVAHLLISFMLRMVSTNVRFLRYLLLLSNSLREKTLTVKMHLAL